jgi:ABC-type nitrate/sulfonate/bicarbonate transport system substrate-binding protein
VKSRFWGLILLLCASTLASQAADAADRIRIAYVSPSLSHAIPWIGKDTGIFRKHGFDSEVVLITGSPRVVQALLAGDIEYAVAGATPAIRARMGGADAVILASLSSVSNMKLMVHPKSGIKRITDLKGKVLGVSQYGSEADVVARIMISHAGLAPRDVNILQLGGHSQVAQALIAGKLDAAILGVQGLIVADKAGARVVATAQELNIFAPNGTLMATRSYIQRNRDSVMRFMRGFVEAVHFFKTQREKSVAIMAKYMGGFSPEILSQLHADQSEDFQALPIPQRDAIQAVLDRETDPKAKSFKPEEFMDASFLQEIERSGFRRTL